MSHCRDLFRFVPVAEPRYAACCCGPCRAARGPRIAPPVARGVSRGCGPATPHRRHAASEGGDEAAACVAAISRDQERCGALVPLVPTLARVLGGGGSGVGAAGEALTCISSTASGLRAVAAAVALTELLSALASAPDDHAVHAVTLAHHLAAAPAYLTQYATISVAVGLVPLLAPTRGADVRTRAAAALSVVAVDESCKDAVAAAGVSEHIVAMLRTPTLVASALQLLYAVATSEDHNRAAERHIMLCAAPVPDLLVAALSSPACEELAALTLRTLALKGAPSVLATAAPM